jgi:hypothetical protein
MRTVGVSSGDLGESGLRQQARLRTEHVEMGQSQALDVGREWIPLITRVNDVDVVELQIHTQVLEV